VERIEASPARRVLAVSPTGSGKTIVAVELIRRTVARGGRALFVDHRREITRQTCDKLWRAGGLDAGVIQAGWPPRPGEPVQVASIQTLHVRAMRNRSLELRPADVLVLDEAHHARATTWEAVVAAYPAARIVGFTATPCRRDGLGLGNIFDEMIEILSVAELIELGFLVPSRTFAPVRPDLTGVRTRGGDYVESELASRMNTGRLVGDIAEHWLRHAERRRTVVFAVDVAHSVEIRDVFRRNDVLAEHIDGSTPVAERDRILADLAAGRIDVVSNCMVLTEGWDCPEVGCLVLARPTKSLGLFRQMIGRGLRPAPGKSDVLILDHSGAVFRHGFVEDPIAWTLDEDERATNRVHAARGEAGGRELTTCPECSAVRYQGDPCPACGWRPVTRPRHVDIAEGWLGEVDRNRNAAGYSAADKLTFHRMLLGICAERGWKPGFAYHKTIERFGSPPPRGHWAPLEPAPAVRAWVRSRNIAYARSQAQQQTGGAR
jgi:superfamily II DNA or RNA helicase